jgi:hypothetical protein
MGGVKVKGKNLAASSTVPVCLHCKDEIPKIRNKYSQERNCTATNSYSHVSVSDLYIPLIGLTILLQEKRWAERGNT